jgi:hypothetical protein
MSMIIRIDRVQKERNAGKEFKMRALQRAEGKKSKNDIPQGFSMTGLPRELAASLLGMHGAEGLQTALGGL